LGLDIRHYHIFWTICRSRV